MNFTYSSELQTGHSAERQSVQIIKGLLSDSLHILKESTGGMYSITAPWLNNHWHGLLAHTAHWEFGSVELPPSWTHRAWSGAEDQRCFPVSQYCCLMLHMRSAMETTVTSREDFSLNISQWLPTNLRCEYFQLKIFQDFKFKRVVKWTNHVPWQQGATSWAAMAKVHPVLGGATLLLCPVLVALRLGLSGMKRTPADWTTCSKWG